MPMFGGPAVDARDRCYRRLFHLPSKHNHLKHASRRRIFSATMEVDIKSERSPFIIVRFYYGALVYIYIHIVKKALCSFL